jgi:CheY-like chemotaxis protein
VISDIGLPDGDGYTLMTELRLAQPDLIGIAISGYGMEEDLYRSRAVGFATHLIKPIQIGDLERVLADILPAAGAAQPRHPIRQDPLR